MGTWFCVRCACLLVVMCSIMLACIKRNNDTTTDTPENNTPDTTDRHIDRPVSRSRKPFSSEGIRFYVGNEWPFYPHRHPGMPVSPAPNTRLCTSERSSTRDNLYVFWPAVVARRSDGVVACVFAAEFTPHLNYARSRRAYFEHHRLRFTWFRNRIDCTAHTGHASSSTAQSDMQIFTIAYLPYMMWSECSWVEKMMGNFE